MFGVRGQDQEMRQSQEREICNEVAKLIARQWGAGIERSSYPEDDNNENAKIDACVTIGSEVFAFEHTLIGPFREYERWNVQLRELESIISADLANVPFSGRASLLVPFDTANMLASRRLDRGLTLDLSNRIAAVLQTLIPLERGKLKFSTKDLSAPFERISVLYRDESAGINGFTIDVAVDDLVIEGARGMRLTEQIKKKTEKLSIWKRRGATTCLVLESRDIQLSSWTNIGDTLRGLASHLQEIDNVYLIETLHFPWLAYPLKCKEEFLETLWHRDKPLWHEISP